MFNARDKLYVSRSVAKEVLRPHNTSCVTGDNKWQPETEKPWGPAAEGAH